MSNIIDNICKLRDAFASKEYNKLVKYHKLMQDVELEAKRHIQRKFDNDTYQLDFTAQDLRELAKDVHKMLDRWDTILNPDKNIKSFRKEIEETHTVNMQKHLDKVLPIMKARRENMSVITEFLSVIEYLGTFLYILELANNDEFAINFTERLF